jgi:hypothetical protein
VSVDSSFTRFYQPPVAFLPGSSARPASDGSPIDRALLGSALAGAVAIADGLLARLQNGIVAFGQIEAEVARLDDRLADLTDLLTPLLPTESRTVGDVDARAYQSSVDDFGPFLADACAVYDIYFGVVRISAMTLLQRAAQVAATAQAVLHDLPYSLLDRTQIVMLIANIGRMLKTVAQELAPDSAPLVDSPASDSPASDSPVSDSPVSDSPAPRPATVHSGAEAVRRAYSQCWQSKGSDGAEWSQAVAFYRWKVGHHFFDLCTIFCGDALRDAQAALAGGDENAAVTTLALADSFLRGTTAAMWYAGDFPANLYRDAVRPSMVMPGKTSGFSGDQNADYNRMKDAKDRLKKFLRQGYGPDLAGLSPRLLRAFMQFHEADIEDSEHHLIIAAHKVGTDQSLAQKEWQAELPGHIHRQKAVDVLREMAESKRREISAV